MNGSRAYAEYNMHFFLPNFPPYTMIDIEGSPTGIGLNAMKPILDSMRVNYTINVDSNHGRALSELKNNRSDGFFMASKNKERDQYAVFSSAVMYNNWVWIVLKENERDFRPSAQSNYVVASLLNTNTNHWLKKSGYTLTPPAWNIESLVKKLDSHEVDAILVAEVVFKHRYQNSDDYATILHEAKPFGVYISKAFISKHPKFMEKLNEAIEAHDVVAK
ncbi:substrate-binding periplasmic protein [Vibrio pectenicida]|nr:transporter substrate-binding domain-containing protein [Vibrio pectenicida]